MDAPHWLLALLPVWVLALTAPGPDTLMVVRTAATAGRRAGYACAAGIGLGNAIWAGAALAGLAVLFAEAAWLYRLVVLLGASYLSVVGARLLLAAWRGGNGPAAEAAGAAEVAGGFRRGLATNLANPKAAMFFASVLAVAAPPDAPAAVLAALVAGAAVTSAGWFALVAGVLAAPPMMAGYRRAGRALDGMAGALFLGLGAALAWREAR